MDGIEVDASERAGETRCPYCREAPGALDVATCPRCAVRLHGECLAALGHCPTLGCATGAGLFRRSAPAGLPAGHVRVGSRTPLEALREQRGREPDAVRAALRAAGRFVVGAVLGFPAGLLLGPIVTLVEDARLPERGELLAGSACVALFFGLLAALGSLLDRAS